jgi:hypothetical protein
MDNRYPTCPPLMSDGRHGTNYYDNDVFNQTIRMLNKIEDNHQYRNFLQSNANELIARERKYLVDTFTCGVHGKCGSEKQ